MPSEDTRLTEIDNVFFLRKTKRLPFEKRGVLAEVKAQHMDFLISSEVIGKFTKNLLMQLGIILTRLYRKAHLFNRSKIYVLNISEIFLFLQSF